jgi:hypothetical protein
MRRCQILKPSGSASRLIDNSETTMRNLLIAAAAVTLTSLAAVQLASAAATIPDNQARVNTQSAYTGNVIRNANAAIDAGLSASQSTRVQFFETPARR